ncbi:hypothetical protein H2198_009233, partial [Neophaeococcomyces mojaviensis]
MAYTMNKQRNDYPIAEYSAKYWYSFGLAIVSIVVALLLFPPLEHTFRYFPVDFILGIAWFAAFTLLMIEFKSVSCDQNLKLIGGIALGGECNKKRAAWGFSFLAGCLFLASFVVGLWVTMRERKLKK